MLAPILGLSVRGLGYLHVRATEASVTPLTPRRAFSTVATQAEQVMPVFLFGLRLYLHGLDEFGVELKGPVRSGEVGG